MLADVTTNLNSAVLELTSANIAWIIGAIHGIIGALVGRYYASKFIVWEYSVDREDVATAVVIFIALWIFWPIYLTFMLCKWILCPVFKILWKIVAPGMLNSDARDTLKDRKLL